MKLAPGGPFTSERKTSPAIEEQMKEAYGLNDPIHEQYFKYLINAAKLDFGPSFKYEGQEVTDIIKRSFPYSLVLGLEAIFIALAFGVLFGAIAAIRHNKMGDYTVMVIAILGISVPSFIMATILQYIFCNEISMCCQLLDLSRLPIRFYRQFALATTPLAFIARLMRSSMLEVLNADYIKTAKSKGLSERVVIYKHALTKCHITGCFIFGSASCWYINRKFHH